MLERIYNFYKGYVNIRVCGNQTERFLNLAVKNSIYIWNLKRISSDEIIFSVSVKGFKKLRKAAFDTGSKIKIISKKGLNRYIARIKRRKTLVWSAIIGVVLISVISSFVLDIEITGNEIVSDDEIYQKLREINLQKFSLRSNIDSDKISLKLINDFDGISWVGVNEMGTRLLIEIKERTLPPKMLPLDIPCHIVAKKDGIISKLTVENGEAQVALNEIVVKGQLLVSGIIPTKYDGLRYVHSMADITAKTWEEKFIEVKLYEYEKIFTGKKTSKKSLKIFSKEFDLSYGRIIPYYNSKETTERKIFGFVEITNKIYEEYTLKKKPLSEEEAIKRGKDELYASLIKDYGKEKVKSVEYQVINTDNETRMIRMIANLEEKIGEEMEITK